MAKRCIHVARSMIVLPSGADFYFAPLLVADQQNKEKKNLQTHLLEYALPPS